MAGDHRFRAGHADTVGMPPQLATIGLYDAASHVEQGSASQIAHGPGGRASRSGGLNLRAVGEVLASYGLDPAEELAKVLNQRKPVNDKDGNPVLDENGNPVTVPVLDTETFVKLNSELLQYTRPKLKAVEVTVKEPELTDEQLNKRIESLMVRVAAGKA